MHDSVLVKLACGNYYLSDVELDSFLCKLLLVFEDLAEESTADKWHYEIKAFTCLIKVLHID